MSPALCDKLPRQAVHRPFGELHPPDGVAGLVNRPNHAIDAPEVFHLVIRCRIFWTVERGWRRRAELVGSAEAERLRKPEPRLNYKTVPRRGCLICSGFV